MAIVELPGLSPGFLTTICMVLGLLVGSFLNVVVYRLPIMLQRDWKQQCREILDVENRQADEHATAAEFDRFNLAVPGSHCPGCHHRIKAWENIPIVSYLLLRGKCSSCKFKISPRYPGVEFVNGLLSGLIACHFGATWLTLALLLFTWSLVVLALIDYDHQLLPDDITIPLLWLGLLVNAVDLGFGVSIYDAVIGAIAGYLSLWSFFHLFKWFTGRDGMGYGDFKLLAALGAWLGWQSLLPIIVLSSMVGAIFGILMVVIKGRDRSAPMPFGPYLAGAGFIVLVWGQQLIDLYINTMLG